MGYVNRLLHKYIEKIFPLYVILPLLSIFIINGLIYWGTGVLSRDWHHYDFTLAIDRMVPMIPGFIWVYIGAFPFWVINYIMVSRSGKENFFRFVTADLMAKVIYFLCFLIIPTTNVRPEIAGGGINEWMVRLIYAMDGGDFPSNLFPSIHCYVSWMCYLGIRGQKQIPIWYQRFSCFFAILIMVSTQVLKQHYIVDVIGGVALAAVVMHLTKGHNWYEKIQKIYTSASGRIGLDDEK